RIQRNKAAALLRLAAR
nr:Chain B, URACIL DNA GLYCOSYLASE (UNG2) [synthetic construct]